MVKTLPDKWIRKAVYDVVNNITVDGNTIFCYDTRLTGNQQNNYILLSTQSNEVDKRTKCGYDWQSQILIEVYTRYGLTGNTGSRLLADNIMNEVRNLTDSLTLDVASGLTIVTQAQSFPSDLTSETNNEIVYRKFIRIEFLIE
jgi:hypothetical protein